MTEIPTIKASSLTEKQQKEFLIKDNVGFGEWDWDILADNWDYNEITEWGLDIVGLGMDGKFNEQEEYNFMNKVTIEFENFDEATAYYENCIDKKLKAKLS